MAVVACQDNTSGASGASDASGVSNANGVAATVLGSAITEDEVTAYIDSFRAGVQCSNDEAWALYLADNNLTARELREATVQELATPIIVKSKAEELGISVDEEAVDAQVSGLRHTLLAGDDDTWQSELARYGMSEEKLRENYSNQNLREQVLVAVAGDVTATDDDLESYIAQNLAGVTTKKVACVYSSYYGNVQNALAAVQRASSAKSGMKAVKASPEQMSVQYADVGWDLNAELTDNMRNVIEHLGKGEVADAPLSEGGIYYLFYVEDAYTFPEDAAKADLSDEGLKQAVAELASATLVEDAGNEWLQRQLGDLVSINDMPGGLSYDVEPKASTEGSSAAAEPADADSQGDAEASVADDRDDGDE